MIINLVTISPHFQQYASLALAGAGRSEVLRTIGAVQSLVGADEPRVVLIP